MLNTHTHTHRAERTPVLALLAALSLVVLSACGSSTAGSAEPGEEVSTVHPACLEALDAVDPIVNSLGRGLELSAEAIHAAGAWDVDRLDEISDKVDRESKRTREARATFDGLAETCREADQ